MCRTASEVTARVSPSRRKRHRAFINRLALSAGMPLFAVHLLDLVLESRGSRPRSDGIVHASIKVGPGLDGIMPDEAAVPRTRPTIARLWRPSRRSPARRPSPWIPRRTMPTCSSPSEVRLHRQRWCAAGAGGRTRPWSAGPDRRRLVHRHQVMSVGRQRVASFTEPQDGWRAVFPTVNISAPS